MDPHHTNVFIHMTAPHGRSSHNRIDTHDSTAYTCLSSVNVSLCGDHIISSDYHQRYFTFHFCTSGARASCFLCTLCICTRCVRSYLSCAACGSHPMPKAVHTAYRARRNVLSRPVIADLRRPVVRQCNRASRLLRNSLKLGAASGTEMVSWVLPGRVSIG